MDDEEHLIDWEQEANAYQKALEAALLYQKQLEETIDTMAGMIEARERTIAEERKEYQTLLSEHLELSNKAQEMVLASYAERLERTIEEQAEEIQKLKQTLQIQQRLLRQRRET